MSRKNLVILVGLFLVAAFLRVYNLEHTSRFIWDESRALVDMHRIWEKHQITFVGPISEDNLEMFPSLTYYLHLPSTVLAKFDPIGPVWTDVFLGLVLWIVFAGYISQKLTFPGTFLVMLLLTVMLPYTQTSRWFWNPNQIPFWFTLALVGIFSTNSWWNLLGGLSLGLSVYHHYLSLFTIMPLILALLFFRKLKKNMSVWTGIIFSLLPILMFELKNHYYSSWFQLTTVSGKHFFDWALTDFANRFQNVLMVFSSHFVNESWWILFYVLLGIVLWKLRKKVEIRILMLTLLLGLILSVFIDKIYPYYLYPLVAVVLFIAFFGVQARVKSAYIFIVLLTIFGLSKTLVLISTPAWQSDVVAVRAINKIVSEDQSKNINIAALTSPDPNTKGQRYRDLALISGKLLDGLSDYPQSRVLYVVSTSFDLDLIRRDQAWEFQTFRNSKLTDSWRVSDLPYYLYRFEK